MKIKDYIQNRAVAENKRIVELETAYTEELATLIEEIYNEDLEVIG